MNDVEETEGECNSKNIIQTLMDTAQTMTIFSNGTKKSIETLITSCHTQGTKGETHKSLFLRKADDMKKLSELYRMVAKRYENAAIKLADGAPENKVLPELISYNIFLSDQLRSEQGCCEKILSIVEA